MPFKETLLPSTQGALCGGPKLGEEEDGVVLVPVPPLLTDVHVSTGTLRTPQHKIVRGMSHLAWENPGQTRPYYASTRLSHIIRTFPWIRVVPGPWVNVPLTTQMLSHKYAKDV